MNIFTKNSQKGITMIELVVVLAVLVLILSTVASIFISFIDQQRKILQNQELLNQSAYVIESMSRTLRTAIEDTTGSCTGTAGTIYSLTNYNSSAGFYQGIKFIKEDGTCQQFYVDIDGTLKDIKNGGAPQNILSSKFTIQYLRFIINGNKATQVAIDADTVKPRVTMVLNIKLAGDTTQQEKIVQTTISQTNLSNLVSSSPLPSPSPGNYVQDVYVTTEGLHIVGGPGCNVGYTSRGILSDCGGGGCQGNQQICVKYGTSLASTVHDSYPTTEGAHLVGGPACNASYTSGGTLADCGGGGCQGNQKICRSFAAGAGLTDIYITSEGLHIVGGPGCAPGYFNRGTIADCGGGGCQGNQQICQK